MKSVYIVIFIIVLVVKVNAQSKIQFPFNELCLSANRTNVADANTVNKFGWGIALYHSFYSQKVVNVLIGFDFNRTTQFKRDMYEDLYSRSIDLTYHINSLSFPLIFRLNFGSKTKFFAENGIFWDCNLGGSREGTKYGTVPFEPVVYSSFHEKMNYSKMDFGLSFGAGVKSILFKHEMILKADYKLGLLKMEIGYEGFPYRYFRLIAGYKFYKNTE